MRTLGRKKHMFFFDNARPKSKTEKKNIVALWCDLVPACSGTKPQHGCLHPVVITCVYYIQVSVVGCETYHKYVVNLDCIFVLME